MRVQISPEEAAGRTVERIVLSSWAVEAVITFTDGTFVALRMERGWEEGEERIVGGPLDLQNCDRRLLVEAGVATFEELGLKP